MWQKLVTGLCSEVYPTLSFCFSKIHLVYCHDLWVWLIRRVWIGFIDHSVTATRNYNQLTIVHNKLLPRTRTILIWSDLISLYSDLNCFLYGASLCMETPVDFTATCWFTRIYLRRNIFIFVSQETCFLTSWFRRIHLCWNAFVNSFPSNGSTCHSILLSSCQLRPCLPSMHFLITIMPST
jgi:hypothetical protein